MNVKRMAPAALCVAMIAFFAWEAAGQDGEKKMDDRVFELRIYTSAAGKMPDLHTRFRDHTVKLLQKHGMELVGFWTDSKEPDRKLIYLVAHKSKAAADASWKAFREDDEWKAAAMKSEENGKLVDKVDTIWLNPTDYSAMK